MVRRGPVSGFETVFRRGDGVNIPVSISGYLVRDERGEPQFLEGTIEDITERRKNERALRESEERFRKIIHTIPSMVTIWDMSLRCMYASPSSFRLTGHTPEEYLNLTLDRIMTPASLEATYRIYMEALERETAGINAERFDVLEIEAYRKDGTVMNCENTMTFLRDADGKAAACLVISTDITERTRAEKQREEAAEALRISEERYRLLAENSGDVILTMDTNLRVTYVSPAVFKLRGMTPEESEGQSLDQIVTPASLEAAFADYLRVQPEIERGENPTSHLELELYRKDGSTIWVEIALTPLRDDTGTLKGFMGVYHDISERRRAEKELRESEEKYKFLVENTTDVSSGSSTRRPRGHLRIELPGTDSRLFTHEAPGMTPSNFSPETRKRVQAGFTRIVAGKEPSDRILIEAEHIARDGRTVWMEINAVLKRYERGKPVAFNGVSRDITERKRNEQALRESERRLGDIINFLPIATLVIDRAGRITAWNRALEEMTGAKAADMIGKEDYEYALPFYGERRPILVDRVFSTEKSSGRNTAISTARVASSRRSHSYRSWGRTGLSSRASRAPSTVPTGASSGPLNRSGDVTEMRRVERELKKAEEKFRTILETMDSGYYEVDLRGTMMYCNPALKNFLGYGKDELEGKNFRDYMDEEEAERITKIFNKVYASGKPSDDFYWNSPRKGRQSAYSAASAFPIMNEGAIVGFRGTVRTSTP